MYENRMTSGWPFGQLNQDNWIIEKEERLVCFGSPGYVDQWKVFATYRSRVDAEKALIALNSRRVTTKKERYRITDRRDTQWVLK